MVRDQFVLVQEEFQERGSQREGDGEEKFFLEVFVRFFSLKMFDGLVFGLGFQGVVLEFFGELVQYDLVQGCFCFLFWVLVNQLEEVLLVVFSFLVFFLFMKVFVLFERLGLFGQVLFGVIFGGFRFDVLGFIIVYYGLCYLFKFFWSKVIECLGQDFGECDDQSLDGVVERLWFVDWRFCLFCVDVLLFLGRMVCLLLKEVICFIQEEFVFDGYLDNGLEVLIMGEYIFVLKDFIFVIFCGVIFEKFCDLYWDEKLLQNFFRVVNGQVLFFLSMVEDVGLQFEGSWSFCFLFSRRFLLYFLGKEKLVMVRISSSILVLDVDLEVFFWGNFEVGFWFQRFVKVERV